MVELEEREMMQTHDIPAPSQPVTSHTVTRWQQPTLTPPQGQAAGTGSGSSMDRPLLPELDDSAQAPAALDGGLDVSQVSRQFDMSEEEALPAIGHPLPAVPDEAPGMAAHRNHFWGAALCGRSRPCGV